MKEKLKSSKSKIFVRILLCVLATVFFILWEVRDYKNNDVILTYAIDNGIANNKVIGEITKESSIEQEITAEGVFSGVQLLMANYGSQKTGVLNVRIEDMDKNRTLLDRDYDISSIKDNTCQNFVLDRSVELSGKTKLKVTITAPQSVSGNAVTIYCSSEDVYDGGDLYIDGKKTDGDLVINNLSQNTEADMHNRFFNRLMIFLLAYIFVIVNCLVPFKKLYRFIFRYRYAVALLLFVFLVANKFHISSIGMYDKYIQTGEGNENIIPVFGEPRAIRSDEWMVSTPRALTVKTNGVGKYNYIAMAEKTPSISVNGIYFDYSALTNPSKWGYYFLDIERAVSFQWCFNVITTFMVSFELCLIISKRKKLLSLCGAAMICFSAFYMWWSTVSWIMAGQAALVLAYYFIHVNRKWQRCLCGFGIGVFFSNYVIDLYPAWQVPSGILFAGILVWMLWYNRKKLKTFDKKDWAILGGTVVFVVSLVAVFLIRNMEYITAINNTVYPGDRVSYGGDGISKLFNFVGTVFFPFAESVNNSENAVMLSFFPVPLIMGAYYLIKQKKKDKLIYVLVVMSLVFSAYCVTDLPETLCRVLLFTYSTPKRMADIVGIAQVYLIIAIAGRIRNKDKMSAVKTGIMALIVTLLSARHVFRTNIIAVGKYQLVFMAVVLAVVFVCMVAKINRNIRNTALILMLCICVVPGLEVHPLMKGLGVVYSKPLAKQIMGIVREEPESRWIVLNDIVRPNFLIACGARTINSTNFVPNIDMWESLGLEEYEDVYNRYAHVQIVFTEEESSMEIVSMDTIRLNLNYDQIKDMDIDYIVSTQKIEDKDGVSFDKIYNHSGMLIYKVEYK